MKTNIIYSSISLSLFILLGVSCSTKRDTFLSRNSHALSTKYNILYNGEIGLEKGVVGISSDDNDNFWKRLPIEKMQFKEENGKKTKNADFELAEKKATKAIQKHSMNIDGTERNFQTDEAYLLLGKSRYYDQRFIPALDAFNYILYKYPASSRIYEAKIWREKTNMRLGNDALVVTNMNRLLSLGKLDKQILSDANALLAEAYLNLGQKDSAVVKLDLAEKFSKKNAQRARYRFILGQLHEELGNSQKAIKSYESVIAMNRKAERKYVIHAQAKKAQLFDFQNGDTLVFLKTFDKLLKDRENRPFLDVLNHQMGIFYDKQDNQKEALHFYNTSLKKASGDQYLVASNYRNIANMYFRNAKYPMAAKYYDSTLTKMNEKSREHIHITKVRKDLDDVILYETIAKRNDSIIKVFSMSNSDRQAYFEKYIVALKKSDEEKRKAFEKQLQIQKNIEKNSKSNPTDVAVSDANAPKQRAAVLPPSLGGNQGGVLFYFYNPTTVSFGKLAFKSSWGSRSLGGNWRMSSASSEQIATKDVNEQEQASDEKNKKEEVIAEYTTDFYLEQLPASQKEKDSIHKERNFAYYQLGVIYKEKFKEYQLATTKLEQLLRQNPEEKLVLPTLYNLYKIYEITNKNKAAEIKNAILTQFPNSRYAQIIGNSKAADLANDSPEKVYEKVYALYNDDKFELVLEQTDVLINQFSGDEIVSKLEFLRANAIGKLRGVTAYKNALQYVADNYPNSEEGKKSLEIVKTQVPLLENMTFNTLESKNWKILYKLSKSEDAKAKLLEDKIKKFIAHENAKNLDYSFEGYKEKEEFLVIKGANSEAYATIISSRLKEYKDYKIEEPAIVLSNENYKVVQIKKNLTDYLALKKDATTK
ncbi:gliding motility protein [Flavobacterium sp. NG2]|uniref:type IX secretion system periplasmic lipoprotein PorW/SprE n=1 Tax=Flavobacterium sp. NG2 TaxID=3097547 RepID=UPI002A7F8F59|nr:tetratricopeptide repeat protein [Flavobacterium sp. NG2]WPR72226.1 gliding motility protein [Flavobacterium sp. NG2]